MTSLMLLEWASGREFSWIFEISAVIFVKMHFSPLLDCLPACKYTPEIFGNQGKNYLIIFLLPQS